MRYLFILFSTALLLVSCAKATPENGNDLEKLAFDAWMKKYVLDKGIPAVEQSNGIYVEFFEDGDQRIESSRDTVMWLSLDYTSTDIDHNVFATRDSMQALRQRTYSPYTHYVPEYTYVDRENYGMMPGQHFALQNDLVKPDGSKMKITEGSHVRLYIPSYLAYGSNGYSNDQGYGGQFRLDGTRIVIQDLAVRQVVKNPLDWEETQVLDHATLRWGLAETDTIATMIYVDTLNFHPRADLLKQFPQKPFVPEYALTADSTAKIWFVGRFLDGFIFDTNIETIHDEFYKRRIGENYLPNDASFTALSYTPQTQKSSYISAFYQAIPDLRRGQWSRIVFTSAYGYGATGLSKAIQQQQEYYSAYAQQYMYSSMMNSMYGNSYYNNYGSNYYYGGYGYGGMYDYYNYSTSGYSETTTEQIITTEIQPYTPLIFELYIEAD